MALRHENTEDSEFSGLSYSGLTAFSDLQCRFLSK